MRNIFYWFFHVLTFSMPASGYKRPGIQSTGTTTTPFLVRAEGSQAMRCPLSHPFAFDGGAKCCETQLKTLNTSLSIECDGQEIHFRSHESCCFRDEFVKCPYGNGIVCGDSDMDGNWKSWQSWSACSASDCTSSRTRHCEPPKLGGLKVCPDNGNGLETTNCTCPLTQADWVTSASSNNVDVNYTRDELYSPNDTLIWIPAGTSQEWVQVDMLTVSDVVKVTVTSRQDSDYFDWVSIEVRVSSTPITGGPQPLTGGTLCGSIGTTHDGYTVHEFVCSGGPLVGRFVQVQKVVTGPWDISEIVIRLAGDPPEPGPPAATPGVAPPNVGDWIPWSTSSIGNKVAENVLNANQNSYWQAALPNEPPFWDYLEVDLGYVWDVVSLTVVSRTQGNNYLTFTGIQSRIGLYPRPESVGNLKHNPICYTSNNSTPTSNVFDYPCATTLSGRFVTLQKLTEGFWHVVEVSINIA